MAIYSLYDKQLIIKAKFATVENRISETNTFFRDWGLPQPYIDCYDLAWTFRSAQFSARVDAPFTNFVASRRLLPCRFKSAGLFEMRVTDVSFEICETHIQAIFVLQ